MKLMQRMKQKRPDNKGFTLVEMIIVIALMGILIGIVGTQVVPYLNRAGKAKDQQVLSGIATAAVSAYSFKANDYDTDITLTKWPIDYNGANSKAVAWFNDICEFSGYEASGTGLNELKSYMGSTDAQKIAYLNIKLDLNKGTVTVEPRNSGNGTIPGMESITVKTGKKP